MNAIAYRARPQRATRYSGWNRLARRPVVPAGIVEWDDASEPRKERDGVSKLRGCNGGRARQTWLCHRIDHCSRSYNGFSDKRRVTNTAAPALPPGFRVFTTRYFEWGSGSHRSREAMPGPVEVTSRRAKEDRGDPRRQKVKGRSCCPMDQRGEALPTASAHRVTPARSERPCLSTRQLADRAPVVD